MLKYVVQWRCGRWVNHKDKNGNTIYFDTYDEALDFMLSMAPNTNTFHRVCRYEGGRKYIELANLNVKTGST